MPKLVESTSKKNTPKDSEDNKEERNSVFPFYNPLGHDLHPSKQKGRNSAGGESDDGICMKGEKAPGPSPVTEGADEQDNDDIMMYDVVEVGVLAVPDGGYGWVIVFASFMCNLVVDGIANSFGVFLPKYVEFFQSKKGSVAWASSILCGVYLCVGPIVSALTNKFGCRMVCIAGAFVAAAGFALSSLSPSLEILIVTYGVIGGIGFGLIYLPSVVCVGYYFESKRAFATGIAVCGSGVGTFVFAPISDILLNTMSWQSANLIFAGVILLCVIFGMLMRPLEVKVEIHDDDDELEDGIPRTNPLPKMAGDHRNYFDRESSLSGSAYFMVQLPDGTMERRLKMPIIVERSGVHASFHTPPTPSPTLATIPEAKSTEANKTSMPSKSGPAPQLNSTTTIPNSVSVLNQIQGKHSFKAVPLGSSSNPSNKSKPRSSVKNSVRVFFVSSKPKIDGGQGQEDDYKSMWSKQELSLSDGLLFNSSISTRTAEPRHIVRPMSRKDIFYTGSIAHLPEYQSQGSLLSYRQSILNFPRMEPTTDTLDAGKGPNKSHKRCKCPCFGSGSGAFKTALAQMMDFSLLKNPVFLFIAISNVFAMLGFYIPFVYIVDAAISKQVEKQRAAFLLSIIGITNTVAKVVTGIVTDLPQVDSLLVNNVSLLMSGITIVCIPLCENYYAFVGVSVAYGLFVSGYTSLTSIILVELLGLDNLTNAFGIIILFQGGATIVAAPVAGALYDNFGSYEIAFYIAGGFFLIAAAMSFLVPGLKRVTCVVTLPE